MEPPDKRDTALVLVWASSVHDRDLRRLTIVCRTRRIASSFRIAGDNPCRKFSVSTTSLSPRIIWKRPALSTTGYSVPGHASQLCTGGKSLVRQIALGGALISIHQFGNGLELVAKHPTVGGADICLRRSRNAESAVELLRQHGIPIADGPSPRQTADGLPAAHSVYFRDPDGNLAADGERPRS
jgi:catechol 2,3-dioxygenase-like lactoylglutathione lyase family enzyme